MAAILENLFFPSSELKGRPIDSKLGRKHRGWGLGLVDKKIAQIVGGRGKVGLVDKK